MQNEHKETFVRIESEYRGIRIEIFARTYIQQWNIDTWTKPTQSQIYATVGIRRKWRSKQKGSHDPVTQTRWRPPEKIHDCSFRLTSARFVTLVTTLRGETPLKRGILRDMYAGLIARPGRGFLSRWWWSRKLGVTNSRRRTSLLKRGEAERRGSAKKGKSYKRGTGHDDGHQTPQHEGTC